jgi:hypothetical protein
VVKSNTKNKIIFNKPSGDVKDKNSTSYVRIARHMYEEGYRTNIGTWINSEQNNNKTSSPQSVVYVLPRFWASDRSLTCINSRAINLAISSLFNSGSTRAWYACLYSTSTIYGVYTFTFQILHCGRFNFFGFINIFMHLDVEPYQDA